MARRRIKELADGFEDPHTVSCLDRVEASKAEWPRSVAQFDDLLFLDAHLEELNGLIAELQSAYDHCKCQPNMSGAPDTNVRPHIQPTTITNNETCNDQSFTRASDKSDEVEFLTPTLDGSGVCLGIKDAEARAGLNPEFLAMLSIPAVQDAASAEMNFYISNLNGPDHALSRASVESAVVMRLAELGIKPSAYEAAQAQMGWFEAMLSVIIIDRNQTHPTNPVRSPGGALRAFTALAARGELNLERSLFGIWGRDERGELRN